MKRGTEYGLSTFVALAANGRAAPVFPTLKGADLNGRSLTLPADFPGPFSLVFVAFKRRQQADVDSWRPFVETTRKKRPSLAVFELPTIARGYRLMQFVIDNGMRSGISDPETRAATVTLYTNVKAFTRALGIRTTRQIAVLVVTPAGEVLGKVSGRYSTELAASINKVLNPGR
jgi:hypothetical protein